MTISRTASAAMLAVSLACTSAFAGLLGHTVSADYLFPDLSAPIYSSGNEVVGAGVEFNNIGGFGVGSSPAADFSDTTIVLTYPAGFTLAGGVTETFDGWVFTDHTAADIVGVTLAATNIAGLDQADISFTGNQVFVNHLGQGSWGPRSFFALELEFAAVPTPAALHLAGLGLLLAGLATRRRGRR